MSFQNYGLKTFFTGEAPFVGTANYVQVVTDQLFSKAMLNTALFTARQHRWGSSSSAWLWRCSFTRTSHWAA